MDVQKEPAGGGQQGTIGPITGDDARQTEIIVNGRPRTVPGKTVDYAQVVKLAFPAGTTNPDIIYTVTYTDAGQRPSSGELSMGGKVKVKKRTIFNVVEATKS